MWERTLSQKSVRLFCEQKVIDEAKADAYVYGYELLISSVVSVLLVVLIAVVCGDVRYALSFLIGFIPQRIYIGGYHATSHTRCYLAFSGLALICILLSKAIAANHLFRILTTVALLGISIFLSPIEAKNNPKFQPMVLPLQVVGHPRHRGHDRSLPRLCLPLEVVLHRACFQPAFVGCLRRHHGASGQVSSHVHFPSQTKPGRALFERPCRVCFFALFSGPAPFCRSRDPGCPAQPG